MHGLTGPPVMEGFSGVLELAATEAGWILAIISGITAILVIHRKIMRRVRQWSATATQVSDVLLGREAMYDSITGQEVSPALPGIGTRMSKQEEQMELLTKAFSALSENHSRIDDHERRITALEDHIDMKHI